MRILLVLMLFCFSVSLSYAYTGQWKACNKISPLYQPGFGFAMRNMILNSAENHIHMIAYYIEPDSVGLSTVEALREAAKRGVKVRVILSSLAQENRDPDSVVYKLLLDETLPTTVEIVTFPDVGLFTDGHFWNTFHEKIILVDGKIAVIGGRHPSATYFTKRDFDFVIEGPVVSDIQSAFVRDWQLATTLSPDEWENIVELANARSEQVSRIIPESNAYFPEQQCFNDGSRARVIHHELIKQVMLEEKPADIDDYSEIKDEVLSAIIERGEKSVNELRFYSMNAIMHPDFVMFLSTLSLNGTEIKMITNSRESTVALGGYSGIFEDSVNAFPYFSAMSDLSLMLEDGVLVHKWVYSPQYQFVHAKLMIMDDTIFLGSYNFNLPSSVGSNEIVIEVEDASLSRELKDIFEWDIENNSTSIDRYQLIDEDENVSSIWKWLALKFFGLY